MKIHRIYNESSEIEDISKDKVQIELSSNLFTLLRDIIDAVELNLVGKKEIRDARLIRYLIDKAIDNQTTEWTK